MRYFLIDKVTELVVGKRIRGIKNVTLSDEVLHDHFPDYPTMPGFLILESASQLAGLLLEATYNKDVESPRRALLVQVDLAKFHATAGPGDQLEILVEISSQRDDTAKVTTEVSAGSQQVARAGLTFVMKSIDSERLHEQRRYLYKLWTRELNPPVTIR